MPSSGFIVALVFLLIFIAGTVACLKWVRHDMTQTGWDKLAPWPHVAAGTCAMTVLLIVIGLFPWTPSYHTMQMHSGTITRVEQRYVTSGSDTVNITKDIAFWLNGEKEGYYTDDIRFQGLKPGDSVTVRRQHHWVYGGQDYWNVKYVDAGK